MKYPISKPGIYHDYPIAGYFADPCPAPSLTQSVAKVLIERSPAHARLLHPRLTPPAEQDDGYDKAQQIGTVAHKALLGRGGEIAVLPFDDFRTKEAREKRLEAMSAGHEVILAKHFQLAMALAESAKAQLRAAGHPVLVDGRSEVVIAWQEKGIWCRSLVDWLHHDLLAVDDIKTVSGSASPGAIPQQLAEQSWDVQAAMIERGLNALDPKNAGRRRFRFIAIEQSPPFAMSINELSETILEIGREKVESAIRRWRKCLETDDWPAYAPHIQTPQYPAYKLSAWIERHQELRESTL